MAAVAPRSFFLARKASHCITGGRRTACQKKILPHNPSRESVTPLKTGGDFFPGLFGGNPECDTVSVKPRRIECCCTGRRTSVRRNGSYMGVSEADHQLCITAFVLGEAPLL